MKIIIIVDGIPREAVEQLSGCSRVKAHLSNKEEIAENTYPYIQ